MKIYNDDCLNVLKEIEDSSVDLIVTDLPYLIKNTKAGGKSELAKSIQKMNNEIEEKSLTNGFNEEILEELVRINKNINMYIWCNKEQIPMYLDFFVNKYKCSFDILCWVKTNAMPLFNNKYLTDKEYCLYFRKNGYCNPLTYEKAKTIFMQPINAKDKKFYNHPTIKPLNIIKTLIENSSKENEVVLDPFMRSGTTGVACKLLNRRFIGIEIDKEYFDIAQKRTNNIEQQTNIFDFME